MGGKRNKRAAESEATGVEDPEEGDEEEAEDEAAAVVGATTRTTNPALQVPNIFPDNVLLYI